MKKLSKIKISASSLGIFVIIVLIIAWLVPVGAVEPTFSMPATTIAYPEADLAWPAFGQAAIGARGYGVLETHSPQSPVPTASVAKVFTALAVLKQKPLVDGAEGPVIIINQADVDSYNSYFTQGGSLAQVALGEKITERQALEALMLPSANNMADTLARWAFGSIDNYLTYVNTFNANLGLKNTQISDASGFSDSTVSSAEDLVKIGQLAVSSPALSSIISEQQATLPVAGVVHNTNWLLGENGINGIKTGNTDAAGGCYLFSLTHTVNGIKIQSIGAVMGAPSLADAVRAGAGMAASIDNGYLIKTPLRKGQAIGEYQLPWGKTIQLVAAKDARISSWYGRQPTINYSASKSSVFRKGQKLGEYRASSGTDKVSVDLIAKDSSGTAPWHWRLFGRYISN